MKFIIDIIKGMFVGVANVIPGVSGGTMAVSMGIYDKLLDAVSNLLKSFKKSVKTLLPIFIGCGIGIVLFAKAVDYLLANQPFITAMAFTGLILGGLPILFKRIKEGSKTDTHKNTAVNVVIFIIFLAISIILPLLSASGDANDVLSVSFIEIVKLFFIGVIASATMIIPGVSGSLILMILGYYFGIISSINGFISALTAFDISTLLHYTAILMPFGIGCVLGVFFISKLIDFLFKRYFTATYSAIIGLIVSSPFAIFYKVQQESSMAGSGVLAIILGIILLFVCAFVTYKLGEMSEKQEEIKAEE